MADSPGNSSFRLGRPFPSDAVEDLRDMGGEERVGAIGGVCAEGGYTWIRGRVGGGLAYISMYSWGAAVVRSAETEREASDE